MNTVIDGPDTVDGSSDTVDERLVGHRDVVGNDCVPTTGWTRQR